MDHKDIERINELYHKSKSVGLTEAEAAEQKKTAPGLHSGDPTESAE